MNKERLKDALPPDLLKNNTLSRVFNERTKFDLGAGRNPRVICISGNFGFSMKGQNLIWEREGTPEQYAFQEIHYKRVVLDIKTMNGKDKLQTSGPSNALQSIKRTAKKIFSFI